MTLEDLEQENIAEAKANTSDEAIYVFKNYSQSEIEQRAKWKTKCTTMPRWFVKEDFVISGVSGKFPGKFQSWANFLDAR